MSDLNDAHTPDPMRGQRNENVLTSRRQTVLHLFSGDLWAGAEVMIFNLLRRLNDYPDLHIIALSLNDGTLSRRLRDVGIETYVIPEHTHAFWQLFLQARRIFRDRPVHLIHAHRYKENLLACLLAKSMGVNRLITTLHGLSEPLEPQAIRLPNQVLKTKLDRFILKHAFSDVVAVSRDIQHRLLQQYGFRNTKVAVIHNGIDVLQFRKRSAAPVTGREVHIGVVGRMVPVKGFDLFLEVAGELCRQTDRVRFSILGDGPLAAELMQQMRRLNLEERVVFQVPRPVPCSYYHTLDLYLNTSLHEGLPLSILEAMACGVPVVAPRVGGIPEIISHGENGLLVAERETKQFVQACLELIKQKERRMKMGERARNRIVRDFTDTKTAAAYRQLYQQTCKTFSS